MKRFLWLVLLGLPAFAQDQKVLFPMLSRGVVNGAAGSSFETVLDVLLPSAQTFPSRFVPDSVSHGRLLTFAAGAEFGYDLISHSAGVPDDITQLPVVRERNLRAGPSTIIGMRVEPKYGVDQFGNRVVLSYKHRNMLRVYDFDNTGRLEVDVIYRIPPWGGTFPGPHLVADRRDGDDASYPAFGEVLLAEPCVSNPQSNICGTWGDIAVEIHPNDPAIRYFPMLSSTDNTTQYVAIRAPQ